MTVLIMIRPAGGGGLPSSRNRAEDSTACIHDSTRTVSVQDKDGVNVLNSYKDEFPSLDSGGVCLCTPIRPIGEEHHGRGLSSEVFKRNDRSAAINPDGRWCAYLEYHPPFPPGREEELD